MRKLRIAVTQIDLHAGNIEQNLQRVKEETEKAVKAMADAILFPELTLTGYPPEDLVFKPAFIDRNLKALEELVAFSAGKDILIFAGYINRKEDIFNAVAVIYNGKLVDSYNKILLPNYGVFDEKRYFRPGNSIPVYFYKGVRLGINICEDIWYPVGPAHFQVTHGGAEILLNISASPFHVGKQKYRERMYRTRSGDESVFLVNCNLVGGQDELVFDGASTVYNQKGDLIGRMKAFEEDFSIYELDADDVFRNRLKDIRRRESALSKLPFLLREISIETLPQATQTKMNFPILQDLTDDLESVYKTLVLGTRDYVNKNGFQEVFVAISGGIDSALVATIAVDALGAERVSGIYLPSQFSADISGEDAELLAHNLGIHLHRMPIKDLFEHYRENLKPFFMDRPFDVAEENLQSRIRGNIVMAFSNKFGYLVLTTGNKSEMSTGYATLYGDMAGGFAVIKDVLKTTVFDLCRYRNRAKEVIPNRIIDRPPSAELRPDQKDTDSLPDYKILDAIIRGYVEEDLSIEEICNQVPDTALVQRMIRLIDRNEYKRRQSPPGIKISPRAFGRDRRMPITNGFR